jgi:FMN phosphatase YigB (HAD superfamily)
MSQKYDLLILDYGGVYAFDYDPASFNQIMLNVFGRQPNEQEKERIVEVATLLGTNAITADDYVGRVAHIMQSPLPNTHAFEEAVISHSFPPSPAMVELVRETRKTGIKASLLSDMYIFELEKMRPTGRYNGFDHTSFSSEIGYMKTSPEAFKATLDHFKVKPEKALFIDDVRHYTEVAKTVDMDILWVDKSVFKTPEQLAETIHAQLGIK